MLNSFELYFWWFSMPCLWIITKEENTWIFCRICSDQVAEWILGNGNDIHKESRKNREGCHHWSVDSEVTSVMRRVCNFNWKQWVIWTFQEMLCLILEIFSVKDLLFIVFIITSFGPMRIGSSIQKFIYSQLTFEDPFTK